MRSWRRTASGTLALLVALLLGVAGLGGGVASAEPFKLCSSFGSSGSELGQFSGESPTGIGVATASGDVYAFDDGANKRVERFVPESGCKYGGVTAFTGSETPAGSFAEEDVGLAVDNSSGPNSGDVYVADTGNSVVDRFGAGGEYLGQLNVSTPDGVAVDAEGNVYVTTFADKSVHEFDPAGTELRQISAPLLSGLLFGVAVDGHDNLYVVNSGSNIVKLTMSDGNVAHEAVFDSQEPTAVATGTSGRVYALNTEGGPHVTDYTTGGTEVEPFGSGDIGYSLALAFGPLNGGGGVFAADLVSNEVHVFEQGAVTALPEPPEISECRATGVTRTGAEAGCTIDPNGPKAEWHIDYGETSSATQVEVAGGEVTATEEVKRALTGLKAGTSYTFKLLATNANGTSEEEVSFTTPPAVSGVTQCQAAGVDGTEATLEAALQSEGESTTWHFEYGLTTSYEVSTTDEQTASATVVTAQAPVSELEGNATYHCRLVATNGFGTTQGEDGTFVTPLVEPVVNEAPPSVSVTRTTALLRGTVNPENSPTEYHFQYVETSRYEAGASDPYASGGETPSASAGEKFGDNQVGPQAIEGLKPGAEYHYRLVASNEANAPGTTTDGEDHTFTTSALAGPHATVGSATEVGQTTATISATVDPSGLPSQYQFEFGEGSTFDGAPIFGSAGEGERTEGVQAHLQGLAPGTTYEFRVTVRNADGQETSGVQTFTTAGIASPISEPATPPLLGVPSLVFPREAAVTPPPKPLTRAQKLAKALKTCNRKPKAKRPACRRKARKSYGPIKKKS
jgi:SMP-30/Gluconolactonase/LRE-like region